MRDYASISPQFWIGKTGKSLRGNMPAQVLAMYLMTCPHSNMIGVYHCPIIYMAHETGMTIEGASKALASLIEAGFCEYEEASETIFVVRMAAFQVGEQLKADDKRVLGIRKAYQNIAEPRMKSRFFDVYKVAFHLVSEAEKEDENKPLESPSEAPPKQLTGTGTGTGEEPKGSVASKLPTCQTQNLIDLYHEVLPELPAVRLLNDQRRKAISNFWKWVLTSKRSDGEPRATNADEAKAWCREYFKRARNNDFLMGRTTQRGEHANWTCDFDFLLTEKGKKHVIEKTEEVAA